MSDRKTKDSELHGNSQYPSLIRSSVISETFFKSTTTVSYYFYSGTRKLPRHFNQDKLPIFGNRLKARTTRNARQAQNQWTATLGGNFLINWVTAKCSYSQAVSERLPSVGYQHSTVTAITPAQHHPHIC
jgi:hypothetical protein